jgi:hypothetical protein
MRILLPYSGGLGLDFQSAEALIFCTPCFRPSGNPLSHPQLVF